MKPAAELNPEQLSLCALGLHDVLVEAPAGCGKTEALAARAVALVTRGEVPAPRRLLAVTFSNKAKASIESRMRKTMTPQQFSRVSVTNLHGLAYRVFGAYGGYLSLPVERKRIGRGAHRALRSHVGVNKYNAERVDEILAAAKRGLWSDEVVLDRIVSSGNPVAMAYETALRDQHTIDFDDLIRYGSRLLAEEAVARQYSNHFVGVLVDEVQDLTVLQLGMVDAIGLGRTTYAGDLAQGIYSFTGADPTGVFAAIRARSPSVVTLNRSYRSSQEVLNVVNILAAEMGATQLACAEVGQWSRNAKVTCLTYADQRQEAQSLATGILAMLRLEPTWSIGLLARTGYRLVPLVTELRGQAIEVQDWSIPLQSPQVQACLAKHLAVAAAVSADPGVQLTKLRDLCLADDANADPDLLDDLLIACEALGEILSEGRSLTQALVECRPRGAASSVGGPISSGVHALSGHVSKGQEFDFVIVVGMEEGSIPSYYATTDEDFDEELRVLHVMTSRARTKLLFTCAEHTGGRHRSPSRWWPLISSQTTEELGKGEG